MARRVPILVLMCVVFGLATSDQTEADAGLEELADQLDEPQTEIQYTEATIAATTTDESTLQLLEARSHNLAVKLNLTKSQLTRLVDQQLESSTLLQALSASTRGGDLGSLVGEQRYLADLLHKAILLGAEQVGRLASVTAELQQGNVTEHLGAELDSVQDSADSIERSVVILRELEAQLRTRISERHRAADQASKPASDQLARVLSQQEAAQVHLQELSAALSGDLNHLTHDQRSNAEALENISALGAATTESVTQDLKQGRELLGQHVEELQELGASAGRIGNTLEGLAGAAASQQGKLQDAAEQAAQIVRLGHHNEQIERFQAGQHAALDADQETAAALKGTGVSLKAARLTLRGLEKAQKHLQDRIAATEGSVASQNDRLQAASGLQQQQLAALSALTGLVQTENGQLHSLLEELENTFKAGQAEVAARAAEISAAAKEHVALVHGAAVAAVAAAHDQLQQLRKAQQQSAQELQHGQQGLVKAFEHFTTSAEADQEATRSALGKLAAQRGRWAASLDEESNAQQGAALAAQQLLAKTDAVEGIQQEQQAQAALLGDVRDGQLAFGRDLQSLLQAQQTGSDVLLTYGQARDVAAREQEAFNPILDQQHAHVAALSAVSATHKDAVALLGEIQGRQAAQAEELKEYTQQLHQETLAQLGDLAGDLRQSQTEGFEKLHGRVADNDQALSKRGDLLDQTVKAQNKLNAQLNDLRSALDGTKPDLQGLADLQATWQWAVQKFDSARARLAGVKPLSFLGAEQGRDKDEAHRCGQALEKN